MKIKKKLIRVVIRKNIPETNSSSSHSVIIDYDSMNNSPNGLIPDKNGIIRIPSAIEEFGWDYRRFNDPVQKIQYYLGLILWDDYYNEGSHIRDKEIYRLKEIIKKFTGAKDVVFEWEEALMKGKDVSYAPVPEVDHQSRDLRIEVGESDRTLKNFIFSSNSWVITGNDNSSIDKNTKLSGIIENIGPDDERSMGKIVRVHFPEPIGDIDLRAEDMYSDIMSDLDGIWRDILNSVRIKIKDNGELFSYFSDLGSLNSRDVDDDTLTILDYVRDSPSGAVIIYVKRKVSEKILLTLPIESGDNDVLKYLEEYKEGEDWVAISTTEYFDEFGTID